MDYKILWHAETSGDGIKIIHYEPVTVVWTFCFGGQDE